MSPQQSPGKSFGQRVAAMTSHQVVGGLLVLAIAWLVPTAVSRWGPGEGPVTTDVVIRGSSSASVTGGEALPPTASSTTVAETESTPPGVTLPDPTLPELTVPEVASYASAPPTVRPLPTPPVPAPTIALETTSSTAAPAIDEVSSGPSKLDGNAAAEFFRGYLLAAGARQYDIAWAMLSPAYQTKYRSFERFSAFWNTVEVTGFEPSQIAAVSADSITMTVNIWFDMVQGGRQHEIVEVDVAVMEGRKLITDYRWLETLG